MSDAIGFQILTDEPKPGKPVRVSLQVHQDRGDKHYYGGTFVEVNEWMEGGSVTDQLCMTLVGIIAQVTALRDPDLLEIMKPVDRPF